MFICQSLILNATENLLDMQVVRSGMIYLIMYKYGYDCAYVYVYMYAHVCYYWLLYCIFLQYT